MRLRLPGGQVLARALAGLSHIAQEYGDGQVQVTSRANLQVRGLAAVPDTDRLPEQVLTQLESTGLVPSRDHDVARNVMASPQTGLAGGRADLRATVAALDSAICADPVLASLPGRFLFVLDDGRGDLVGRDCDLALVALTERQVQLRIGDQWGSVLPLVKAVTGLTGLARDFLTCRGRGPTAAWHVRELDRALTGPDTPDPRLPPPSPPPGYGDVPGGHHLPVPEAGLDHTAIDRLCAAAPVLIITPWRGVLIPQEST